MAGRNDTAVVKIGTSSITDDEGVIDRAMVAKLCDEVAALRATGRRVGGDRRPRDPVTLQAVAAGGQGGLIRAYREELGRHDLTVGQVLLAPLDFFVRAQYLHARGTLTRLLELGVVPVVNENDAIADDEIRFGDNDRIAALVAHLVVASTLVLLTDTPGLFTADPRLDREASLIEEIVEIDHELEGLAGRGGSIRGSGGMASKLAATKIARWSGVRTVIADAGRTGGMVDACEGGVGGAPWSGPGRPRWGLGACGSLSLSDPRVGSPWTPGPAGLWRSVGSRCCRPGWWPWRVPTKPARRLGAGDGAGQPGPATPGPSKPNW